MAGYDNIKDHGFDKRTAEEQRQIAIAGGKASGKARRHKANFRKMLNQLLTAEIDSEYKPFLDQLGIDCTLEAALNMAMIKKGLSGDVKAYEAVAKYSGQGTGTDADLEEQRIRTDRAKRARDQETGNSDSAEESISAFMKAMNPTQEELSGLFENEEDGGNAEETEETGSV